MRHKRVSGKMFRDARKDGISTSILIIYWFVILNKLPMLSSGNNCFKYLYAFLIKKKQYIPILMLYFIKVKKENMLIIWWSCVLLWGNFFLFNFIKLSRLIFTPLVLKPQKLSQWKLLWRFLPKFFLIPFCLLCNF